VAVADIGKQRARVLAFDTFPYPASIRRQLFQLFPPGSGTVADICHLNFVLGELFAEALMRLVDNSGLGLKSLDLIGSHGQTVCHIPQGRRFRKKPFRSTLQIGEPAVIVERTGITTVADFRTRDIAAHGEGAPLVPFADHFLFQHKRKTRALQNIGGIANVTFLPASGTINDVIAFDTGPGNMMIDRVTLRMTKGAKSYDASGRLACKGKIIEPLLCQLMRHKFLLRQPPKSTGREDFGTQSTDTVYDRAIENGIAPQDILTTITAYTARSIADAYRRHLPCIIDEVILCGGGAHNDTLVALLKHELHPSSVILMDAFGINVDAKEAVSFAILAYQTIRGVANNVPSATGAMSPVVMGKIMVGNP